MIVIADSSPLYFILLEQAEVLRKLYGRVIVPEAVVRELKAEKAPDVVRQMDVWTALSEIDRSLSAGLHEKGQEAA